ncbi:pre-peptidase C-terminal domain-containing protein [Pleionea sediminis]|uniref:pre-peptidase C-terminal domain-containing protein n=1 Tax=Pleionea sediminis TaxID=2569479 RepID=UPI001184DBD8|nr:pre-peptidase C-terminal domain-containing protein [Pleionea sediminis]
MKITQFFLLLVSIAFSCNLLASKTNAIKTTTIDGRKFSEVGDMLILEEDKLSKFDVNKDKWTDGKVFYEFASDVTQDNRDRFVDAYQEWESVADLEFIERTNQSNYIYVQNDNRNYAIVGMIGGRQILSMNNWYSKYVIVHEIGHSLGMWHEHMRSDRDNYVTIAEDNIKDTERYNFRLKSTTDYGSYDFLSIMHYHLTAYTVNGEQTIVPKPGYEVFSEIAGQRKFISGGDQLAAATHYGPVIIDIEDQHFKSYLLNNFDSNADGEIDTLEAVNVTEINTPGNGNITSLGGIEYFRYLTSLNASNENLSSLPAIPSRIQHLDLRNNNFETVDFLWSEPPFIESISISGNPLDAYACNELIVLTSALNGGTLNYNPLANGSNLVCDENSRFVLVNGKPREDLRSKQPQTYFIDVPAGQAELTINTTRFENLDGGLMDMYVAFDREPTREDFDYSSTNSDNTESVTINNPTQGTWYISLIPNERSFENVTLIASYSDEQVDDSKLENGIAKTGLSADQGDTLSFYFDVPENSTNLQFQLSGGSGDADLYVRFAQAPTLSVYDCRPYLNGNDEACLIENIQPGRYYVNIRAYNAFSDLSLVASYEEMPEPVGGVLVEDNLSGYAGSWKYFTIEIPANTSLLNISISGNSGDADLYVKKDLKPTTSSYECRPYRNGSIESCRYESPTSGTYYIGLRGYSDYSDVTLEAIWE